MPVSRLFNCVKPRLVRDQGYAWLILILAACVQCLGAGFSFAIVGNLTVIHQTVFNIDLQQSSLIGSVHTGIFYLFASISSVIIKYGGCKGPQVVGGACIITALALSSLATEPWHAFLLFGVLAGIGVANCHIATLRIVALYFDKRKNLAFPVSIVGAYVGVAVWTTVSQHLFHTFGYSKAMAIMASFHTVHIIAGVLYFPINLDSDSRADSTSLPPEEVESCIDTVDTTYKEEATPQRNGSTLKEDFQILLTSAKVWAFLVNCVLWQGNASSYLILVTNYVLQRTGVTIGEAALGVTLLGVGTILGCAAVALLSVLSFDRLILHFLCSMLYGTMTVLTAFTTSKEMFYVLAVTWGFGNGALIANFVPASLTLCTFDQLNVFLGLEVFAEGIGAIGTSPLCGLIAANTSDKYGMIFSGTLGISASLCVLPILVHNFRVRRRV